jgi:hypothetical protein
MGKLMSSFFYSIRDYFKSEYNGRYFSILLRELAQNEPRSFCAIIDRVSQKSSSAHWKTISAGLREGTLNAICEHGFLGRTQRRRSDVAFLRENRPVLFIEVKEFDNSSPTNPQQLADYLDRVRDDLGLIYVYRFLPELEFYNKILRPMKQGKPVVPLSYDEIYEVLARQMEPDRPVAKLVCSYLEDIGVGIYTEIDLKGDEGSASKFLLAQMLAFPQAAGMGRLQGADSVRKGPELLKKLLGNIEYIGEWIRDENLKIIPQHFNQRFWINPEFNHKKLRRALRDSGDVVEGLPPEGEGICNYVEGGTIFFVSQGTIRLPSNDGSGYRPGVVVGIGLELNKGSKIKPYVYSCFYYGKQVDGDETEESSDYLKSFPTRDEALIQFRRCLGHSLKRAQKQAHGAFSSVLQKFKIPPVKATL